MSVVGASSANASCITFHSSCQAVTWEADASSPVNPRECRRSAPSHDSCAREANSATEPAQPHGFAVAFPSAASEASRVGRRSATPASLGQQPAHLKESRLPLPASVRTVTGEHDEWSILDVELAHLHAPATFEIPDAPTRAALLPGDFAKLLFEGADARGARMVERMWVKVLGTAADGYTGVLVNESALLVGRPPSPVCFAPRHVAAIAWNR